MMIEIIRKEHGYMVRLLAILRRKLSQLKQEQPINYSLVKEIVDYLANHSEKVHHPKEDILYNRYIELYGSDQLENLTHEHEVLAEKTHAFLALVEMILSDAVVPQHMFVEHLEDFIHYQKRHLDFEERAILPVIEQVFTDEDWAEVDKIWAIEEDDPVFGAHIADKYRQLADRVRQNNNEYF
ncbi:hemerythrin domain-containing protein [Vibrio sp. S4M6]|uniref:hemerythrin domain-containing protein n=1 Tax=Vibrio sinus TaxID=2946865 RepID=UPI00202A54C2|nr:hemerythrin domain-containing protein [Vibrio sinus]MCL9781455.1 hemerythrin domain-containing protein [Vibrio sinus]